MGKVKCKRAIRRVQNIVTMIANENNSVSASIAQREAKKGGLKSGLKPASEMESRRQEYLKRISERNANKKKAKSIISAIVTDYLRNRAKEKLAMKENKEKAYSNRDFNKMLKKEKLEKAA